MRSLRACGFLFKLQILVAIALIMAVVPAPARPADHLFSQELRPTIADILRVDPELSGAPQLEAHVHATAPGMHAMQGLAESIVNLEVAFPGGRFFSLGRDVVALGDALDAFYTIVAGQPGRVGRIDASTPSFSVLSGNLNELIVDYLKDKGLNYETILNDRPFVVFDYTSFQNHSQSRLLMTAAYLEAARLGIPFQPLMRKLNFANVHGPVHEPIRGWVEKSFRVQEASLNANGLTQVMTILSYQPPIYEWHDSFQSFRRLPNGKVATVPGSPADHSSRKLVIDYLYQTIAMVKHPQFIHVLKEKFEAAGLQWDQVIDTKAWAEKEKAEKERIQKKKDELMERLIAFKDLPPLPEEKTVYTLKDGTPDNGDKGFSTNGWQVVDWYQDAQGLVEGLNAKMVIFMLEARAKGRLGGRETRRFVRQILKKNEFSDFETSLLAKYFRENPERLSYTHDHIGRAGQEKEVPKILQLLMQLDLPKTCRDLLTTEGKGSKARLREGA